MFDGENPNEPGCQFYTYREHIRADLSTADRHRGVLMQIFYELPLPQTRHSMVSLTAGARESRASRCDSPQVWEKNVLVVWNMWGRSILTWSLIFIHSFIYLCFFF